MSLFALANVAGYIMEPFATNASTWVERKSTPLSKKLNPVWWFKNDFEEQLPSWYMPHESLAKREFYWNFLRNPLQNFRHSVVGVSEWTYTVRGGPAHVWTVQRNDLPPPENGYQWSVIQLGIFRLPFVSYSGEWVVWYIGWQPSGFFGAKFNILQ